MKKIKKKNKNKKKKIKSKMKNIKKLSHVSQMFKTYN